MYMQEYLTVILFCFLICPFITPKGLYILNLKFRTKQDVGNLFSANLAHWLISILALFLLCMNSIYFEPGLFQLCLLECLIFKIWLTYLEQDCEKYCEFKFPETINKKEKNFNITYFVISIFTFLLSFG